MRSYAALPTVVAVVLAGCASLPADHGIGDVDSLVAARGRSPPTGGSPTDVRQLLSQPLTADVAVTIALVQNPTLRVAYARLGIAGAEVYDAGHIANPRLSASYLFTGEAGAADQFTFGLAQSFTSLLLMPARGRFAAGEFERAKLMVGAAVLDLAAEVESAHFRLVGAQQLTTMRSAIARAARASADLAQRFFDAGNITRLELSLQQAQASQASLNELAAQAEVAEAHAELNRLMGFAPDGPAWSVAASLPVPLATEDTLADLLKLGRENRLDLLAATRGAGLLADSLGLARRYRYLGEVEVGVETERDTDGSHLTGPTLSLELPLFNQGGGAIAKAQARLDDAQARRDALELKALNAIQLAQARVASAKARAVALRSALIPQREEIVARTQEQVNYMLAGQFALLLAKQQEYEAYEGYLEAVRDYWLARVELAKEVGTQLPSSAQPSAGAIEAESLARPKDEEHTEPVHHHRDGMPGMDHSAHPAPAPGPQAPAEHPHHHHGGAP